MPGLVLAERLKKEPVATCLVGMLEEFSENNKCFGKMSILFSPVVSYPNTRVKLYNEIGYGWRK